MPAKPRKPGVQKPARTFLDPRNGCWNWKPAQNLRPAFENVQLGRDTLAAWRIAGEWNAKVDAWLAKGGKGSGAGGAARPARAAPLTVGQMIGRFKQSREWRGLAPRTQAQYAYELTRLEDEFGHEVAAGLTPERVADWADDLADSAPQTLRHVAARGRQVFNFGKKRLGLKGVDNPFASLGTGSGNKRRMRASAADMAHVVATADAMKLASIGTLTLLLFTCLMRVTDGIVITAASIVDDPAGPRVCYRQSKTFRRTDEELDFAAPAALLARLAEWRDRQHPLVISEETDAPYHEKTVSRVFGRVVARAIEANPRQWKHLKGLQLRDMRRSGFVYLLEKGMTVEDIVCISGHTIAEGMEIVEHYAPRTATRADRAMAAMDIAI
jgi:hypothetical protein